MGCRIAEALGIDCSKCVLPVSVCPELGLDVSEAVKAAEANDLRHAARDNWGNQVDPKFYGDLEAHKEIFLNTARIG